MKYLFLLLLSMVVLSCGGDRTEANTNPQASVVVKIDSTKTIAELREEKNKLELELSSLSNLIKQKERDKVEFWSKLVGGIALGLGAVCIIASFVLSSYPLVPVALRYASYILTGVGLLSFTAAYLYPYLIPIGLGTLFVILVAGAFLWFRDRSTLVSVTRGIEELKVSTPHYKDVLRKHIKGKKDEWVGEIRKRL